MAWKNIEVLEKLDAHVVITECGSCSSFLKEYSILFQDDLGMLERAKNLAKRVRGFSEFLQDRMPASMPTNAVSGKVTYHDPCHMS